MYISFEDLAIFLVVCVAVTAGIFLIIALVHFIRVMRKIGQLVDSNKNEIDQTIKVLPTTVSSLGDAAESIKITSDKASGVIGTIDGAVTSTVETVNDTSENVYEIIKVAGLVAKFISDAFKRDDD